MGSRRTRLLRGSSINLNTPDEECDLNYTPNIPLDREINYAMSNSFGFGGHNGVLIFGKN